MHANAGHRSTAQIQLFANSVLTMLHSCFTLGIKVSILRDNNAEHDDSDRVALLSEVSVYSVTSSLGGKKTRIA